jgi:hypothetical protein
VSDVDRRRIPLRLHGMEYLRTYEGDTYRQLPGALETRIDETELIVHLIRAGTPEPAGVRPGEWRARYGREDDLPVLTAAASINAGDFTRVLEDGLDAFTVFDDGFQYLRADRVSPAVTYPRSHEMSARRGFLGAHGEFTVDYLGQHHLTVGHPLAQYPGTAGRPLTCTLRSPTRPQPCWPPSASVQRTCDEKLVTRQASFAS